MIIVKNKKTEEFKEQYKKELAKSGKMEK